MKKLLIILSVALLSIPLLGQNEYRYIIYAYGGLKVGTEARIASMAEIDSIKVSSGDLLFYVGATPYYGGATSPITTGDTATMLINYPVTGEYIAPGDTAAMLSHYVTNADLSSKADVASPTFTGLVTAPQATLTGNRDLSDWASSVLGLQYNGAAASFTDNGPLGTRANRVGTSFGIPTFVGDNAVTVTTGVNVYIAGPPAAGTEMTITNPYSLYVATGNNYLSGVTTLGTGITIGSAAITEPELEILDGATVTTSDINSIPDLPTASEMRTEISDSLTQFVTDGTNLDSVALLKTTVLHAKTTSTYTLAITDRGETIIMQNTDVDTVYIPTNASVAFAVGDFVNICSDSTGSTLIKPVSGVSLRNVDSDSIVSASGGYATLLKRATNSWDLFGKTE